MHGYGVFEMCRNFAVAGHYAPSVGEHCQLVGSERYHWFDGYAKPVLELFARTLTPVIGHLRVFVHVVADAVTDKFSNDSVTMAFAMLLDGVAYVANAMACDSLPDSFVKGLFGDTEKFAYLWFHLAYTKRVTGITAETIDVGAAVY